MDTSYDPYRFLYDTYGGERKKFHSFIMIARQFTDNFYGNINEETEIFENNFYNGTNELVKIFNQKCVICMENDSIYSFRRYGHMCLCESCYQPEITKCIVCRT